MALVAVKAAGLGLLVNYGVHVGSSTVYGHLCTPSSIWDLGRTLVATASPVCTFLLNTMVVTQSNYAAILTTTIAVALGGLLKTA